MRRINLLVALIIALGGQTKTEAAEQLPLSSFIHVGELANTPIGWIEFCGAYRSECAAAPSHPVEIVLTPRLWKELQRVNASVNEKINPLTDIEHWGAVERWNFAEDGYGDCEDYVLVKRRMLIEAGYPRSALLITVVIDGKGAGHAILTVVTDRGDFVLDNGTNKVKPWHRTGYHFVRRQSQWDPDIWLSLGGAVATTGGR